MACAHNWYSGVCLNCGIGPVDMQSEIARLQAEVERLTAGLEFWMSDHDKRWVAQMGRADRLQAEVSRLQASNNSLLLTIQRLTSEGAILCEQRDAAVRALNAREGV